MDIISSLLFHVHSAVLLARKISSEQFLCNLVATPKGIALKTCLGWQLEGGRYK